MKYSVTLIALALGACLPEKPACSYAQLAAIETSYITTIVDACQGHTLHTCPAAPEIEEQYAKLREEWVQCR